MKSHASRDCGNVKSYFCTFCKYGMYPCPQCPRVYSHYTSRYRHLKYECGKSPTFKCMVSPWFGVGFPCPNCPKIYKHYQSRNTHLKYECGKEPTFKCTVPECTFVTKRKGSLKAHLIGVSVSAVSQNLQAPTVEEYPFEVRVRQEPAVPVRSTLVHVPSQEEVHLEGPHAKRS
ncbi:hypothetical protein GEV33_002918 [Tenebrio molitor]|uniref:C2H2-type domain-containing protein n=1 Tax=Tenebrio molitor TaxID=7067 RepID=A0A8J6HUK3_TENMO|nr:hypothetical protein GEV33_002918 [Tenebrio molitor]